MYRLAPVFVTLLALASATPATAQTGSRLLLRPFRHEDQVEINADSTFMFGSETSNATPADGNFDFRADSYNLDGRIRLTHGMSQRGFARAQPGAGFATRYIQLHTSDPALPEELFDGSAGVAMGVLSHQGWIGGISLGVGHAGVDFEEDGNALYVQGTFALGRTFENGDALGLVLEYNGNRSFLPDWPLPGFQFRKRLDRPRPVPRPPPATNGRPQTRPDEIVEGYEQRPDPPKLVLAVGLPFSQIEWRPTDRARFELMFSLPQNLNVRADYTLLGDPEVSGLGVYASLNRTVGAFHWNQLPGDHRLIFRQTFAEAGVNWRLHDRLELLVAGGYAFDQEFETGWDTRDADTIAETDDAPYVRALARLRL